MANRCGPIFDSQSSTPPLAEPRHSMQRKLVLWTVSLVGVSTMVCALWLSQIATHAMRESHLRNVMMLNNAVAAALAGQVKDIWNPATNRVLGVLKSDSRLAFVIVTDTDGSVLHRLMIDPSAWAAYTHGAQWMHGADEYELERAVELGEHGDLIVHKTAIWNPPLRNDTAHRTDDEQGRVLEGFVVLAVREPGLPHTLAKLRAAQVIAACVICLLSVPVVIWAARRWASPFRALLEATISLSQGREPPSVPVGTQDELGLVAQSFNDMAHNLSIARQDLERANQQLEEKVQDRTAELERVNHKLEVEIHDKDDFLRAVTHDLNTPLRNIAGMASTLLVKYQSQLSEDVVKRIERIRANVKMQTELINDLFEISRIRTQPGKQQNVDLQKLVEQLRDQLSYDLDQCGATLVIDTQLPIIIADRNRVRQLFQNILENAIKYMTQSPRRVITIHYQREGVMLHLSVSDTGQGIAQQDLSNIFQVFRRAKHSGSHAVAGRGVGLATVKSIVESYGGRVWVQSELGSGSTFHFTLDGNTVDPPILGNRAAA